LSASGAGSAARATRGAKGDVANSAAAPVRTDRRLTEVGGETGYLGLMRVRIPDLGTRLRLSYLDLMSRIKISSRVVERVWRKLMAMAHEAHQSVAALLTQAIAEYLGRRRVRPVVRKHLEDSIARNQMLGELLACSDDPAPDRG